MLRKKISSLFQKDRKENEAGSDLRNDLHDSSLASPTTGLGDSSAQPSSTFFNAQTDNAQEFQREFATSGPYISSPRTSIVKRSTSDTLQNEIEAVGRNEPSEDGKQFLVTPHFPLIIQQRLFCLNELCAGLNSLQCRRCSSILLHSFNVIKHVEIWAGEASNPLRGRVLPHVALTGVKCIRTFCSATTCLGCGRAPSFEGHRFQVGERFLNYCCEEGRVVALWLLLSYFDEKALEEEQARADPITQSSTQTHTPSVLNLLAAREPEPHHGTLGLSSPSFLFSEGFEMVERDHSGRRRIQDNLNWVEALLPDVQSANSALDQSPPETLEAMLVFSSILEYLAAALSNDSIEEAYAYRLEYMSGVHLVQRLQAHTMTRDLVTAPRLAKKRSGSLMRLSIDHGASLVLERATRPSVGSSLTNILRQSKTVTNMAQFLPEEYGTLEQQTFLETLYRIAYVSQDVMPKKDESQSQSPMTPEQEWDSLHRKSLVKVIKDELVLGNHVSSRSLRQSTSRPAHGRLAGIVKEIAAMLTALPKGIFVRVAESQIDVMKALIVGPEGTPYDGGLFEFDIYCDESYPQRPPLVTFTHAASVAGLSPCLFPNGGICLSLLDTTNSADPSDSWQPGTSTLLQLLVSLQAMVFVPKPARKLLGGTFSARVNPSDVANSQERSAQACTIAEFMLPWLRGEMPNESMQLWGEVSQQYYRVHAERVAKLVEEDAAKNRSIKQYVGNNYPRMRNVPSEGVPGFERGKSRDLTVELRMAVQDFRSQT